MNIRKGDTVIVISGDEKGSIGRVLAVQMDEAVLDARGRFDIAKAQPFAYLSANSEYRQLGELLGTHGYSEK